jgi:hypothetical protein
MQLLSGKAEKNKAEAVMAIMSHLNNLLTKSE